MVTMRTVSISDGLVIRFITVIIFVILSIAGFVFSAYMFIEANSTYTFVLASIFLSLSLFAGFFNVYASVSYFRSYYYTSYLERIKKSLKPLRKYPTVAVVVPTYNEDPSNVKKNMERLMEMDYPKDKIKMYLLDDSTKENISKELSLFSRKNGIAYIHRDDRAGYKAGALNNMLNKSKEEFIAIFDSDEYLTNKRFLKELLPYFEDPALSYLQTEKRYAKGTFFSDAVDLFDAFFFKFIQPHRALNNTALFAGSCGIIRKSALVKIGGFPEYVIEDTFFSLESDLHNFKGLYVPEVYALGAPISTYTALVKQQWRYNYGDTQFIKYFFKRSMNTGKISSMSMMDYWTHGLGLNYLSVILIMFTILSVFISFSTIPFAHMTIKEFFQASYLSADLEIFGGIAFVLSFLAPVILTKIYFKSVKKGFMIFVLNFALAVVRTKAAIAAIFMKDPSIHWIRSTDKNKNNLIFAVRNTKTEITLAATLFVLGYVALMNSNIAGWIWLTTYGVLYFFATILLYKYG